MKYGKNRIIFESLIQDFLNSVQIIEMINNIIIAIL